MNNPRMLAQEEETDDSAEVTWEDQQRINAFSKLNTRYRSIKEKLEQLKQEKEAFDDLAADLELADELVPVLYKIGEAFVRLSHAQALQRLAQDTATLDSESSSLLSSAEECEREIEKLKIVLYAKFGRAINLDE